MPVGHRIPVALQQVFLASQAGEDVATITAPESGDAFKMYQKEYRKPIKPLKKQATPLRRQRIDMRESAADVYRKTNPISKKTEVKLSEETPQGFLEAEFERRGYSTKKYVSLEGGYYARPTLLQKASFGTTMNQAIITSDASLLRRLLDVGLSPNPCNDYGESLVHRVCRRGDHKLLRILLEKGCCLQIADDYGRTPLHDAFWKADPSAEVLNLILRADKDLIRLMDCRGFTPLNYVRKEAHGDMIDYLKSVMDEFFPDRTGKGPEPAPPLTKKKPNTTPVPDPRMALTPQSAMLVASGEIEPEDALDWDDDSSYDSEYDSDDDSYSDSDSEFDQEELAELCLRAGGPIAVAQNCFGESCRVTSRSHKLN
ncbi:unnamed protein product [Cylindrotheca closterium]|uniref:Uncharacterized protein n=1 Tax=Cylindrotheca closterium TaxID=2856 RepID=A0AAD2PWV9_9STRA|nr:unnamed protein product [Cylindrotheca closterium]